jgi:hypothetical protein
MVIAISSQAAAHASAALIRLFIDKLLRESSELGETKGTIPAGCKPDVSELFRCGKFRRW